jgi:mannose-6-phosphate isomerase-like protein (cupin superfamily)
MTEKIIKNIIKRKISPEIWGQVSLLANENNFAVQEYIINPHKTLELKPENRKIFFIIVSGSAEFNSNNITKKLFKGDKIDILPEKDITKIIITNCGVLPLIFIGISV